MKTFYQLTPSALKACIKIEQAQEALIDATNEGMLEYDNVHLDEAIDQSDIMYLFNQYHDQEFCDHDYFNGRQIDFTKLEQQGLIRETFRKDPCQI